MAKLTYTQLGITDAHTHAGGIAIYNFVKTRYPIAHSIRDLVLKARLNNIDNVVAFPMPMPLYYHPRVLIQSQNWQPGWLEEFPYELSNKALLYEIDAVGQGMILPFMAIDPKERVDDQAAYLEKVASSNKIYGLKLHTLATGSSPIDLIGSPFIALLRKYDLPLLIHSGISPSSISAIHILYLASHYPDIRICIAHLANLDRDVLTQIPTLPNVYVDCSPFLTLCKFARARDFQQVSQQLFDASFNDPAQCLIDLNSAIPGRLIWGTDEPWTTVSDSNGNLISNYTYADECAVLDRLVEIGRLDVKGAIAQTNTARFLFGSQGI